MTRARVSVVVTARFFVTPFVRVLEFWSTRIAGGFTVRVQPTFLSDESAVPRDGAAIGSVDEIRVVCVRPEDVVPGGQREPTEVNDWVRLFMRTHLGRDTSRPAIVVVWPSTQAPARGFDDAMTASRLVDLICSASDSNVAVVSVEDALRAYGVNDGAEDGAFAEDDVFMSAGAATAREIYLRTAAPPKVIAVDCDGTLWQGQCGEQDPAELVQNAEHIHLQMAIRNAKASGALLAVVSKNDERDVRRVFESASRPRHIAASDVDVWRVNWRPKSHNLASIATELSIGIDSILFVDDDPFECGEVRAGCLGAAVLALPEGRADRIAAIDHCWPLSPRRPVTQEDEMRSSWYRSERPKWIEGEGTTDLDWYLERTGFRVHVRRATASDVPRVAQLIQRANQFNNCGIRFPIQHVAEMTSRFGSTWVAEVRDEFGEYGIVGAALGHTKRGTVVESLVISCRAIGKHVEDELLHEIAEAERSESDEIELACVETGRNGRFLEFVRRLESAGIAEHRGASLFISADQVMRLGTRKAFGYSLGPYEAQHASPVPAGTPVTATLRSTAPSGTELPMVRTAAAMRHLCRAGIRIDAPPANETVEKAICRVWTEMLGIESVQIDTDDFFALGGDSLQAVDMLLQLSTALGVEIPLALLFEDEFTVAKLASTIARLQSSHDVDDDGPSSREDGDPRQIEVGDTAWTPQGGSACPTQ